MSQVAARELRNNTADVLERARNGEIITITVNGVPAAQLSGLRSGKKASLTKNDLLALRPKPGAPAAEEWDHELDGDTTDDLKDHQ
jgi:prevent-host-death family protein